MRQHTLMGEQIIAAAGPSLDRIGPLVRASHERWDGKGYPDGLAGEEIPLGARIITICDSFRAMLDERVYKQAMSLEDALEELRRCAGTQFDPQLVEVFCRLVSERLHSDRLRRAPRCRSTEQRARDALATSALRGDVRGARSLTRPARAAGAAPPTAAPLPAARPARSAAPPPTGRAPSCTPTGRPVLAQVQRQAHGGQAGDVAERRERHAAHDVQHRAPPGAASCASSTAPATGGRIAEVGVSSTSKSRPQRATSRRLSSSSVRAAST